MLQPNVTASAEPMLPPSALHELLLQMPDAFTVMEQDGRISFANEAAARMLGYPSPAALCTAPLSKIMASFSVLDELGQPLPLDRLPNRIAMEGRRPPEQIVRYRVLETGEERWSAVSATPLFGPGGRVQRVLSVFRDVTEQRRSALAVKILSEASAILSESLDYELTLAAVARAAVPAIADWCAVEIVDPETNASRQVAVAHVDPEKVKWAEQLRKRYPPNPDEPRGVPNVLRTGVPEMMAEIPQELIDAAAIDEEHRQILREIGFRSYMVVPLKARGRVLGALTLVSAESRRSYGPFDLALAEGLASRASLAVDNARLFTEAQDLYAEALRSNERLELSLHASRMGAWEWDIAHDTVTWTPSLEALHGIPIGSFPGTFEAYLSDIHPDERPRVREALLRAVETKSDSYHLLYRIIRPDGAIRWIEPTGRYVEARAGRSARMIGVCADVTERKEAEEAAQRLLGERAARVEAEAAKQRIQQILESITDPFFVADPDLRLMYANEAAADLAPTVLGGPLGKQIKELFPEAESARFHEESQRARAARTQITFRDHLLAAGRWFEVHAYPMSDGISFYLRDVTPRRAAEEERRRAEIALEQHARELARSNADLQQFAYVASHDLKEPLRMVASYTQLLARRYKGKLGADADEFIGYAVDGASRMQALIDDLLSYSRIGTRANEPAPVRAGDSLDAALHNLRAAIEQSGAVVTHDALPEVAADGSQLVQLFQNLIGNALKFRGREPPRVHVAAERRGDAWEISVRDNGIGIASEYRDRVFVIFQRLHTRGEYPGNGIGLSICKKIVERHGGRIWIESADTGGSIVHFTLPVKPMLAYKDD